MRDHSGRSGGRRRQADRYTGVLMAHTADRTNRARCTGTDLSTSQPINRLNSRSLRRTRATRCAVRIVKKRKIKFLHKYVMSSTNALCKIRCGYALTH